MDNEFKIDIFLEENYRLFAIIGIFGAISIYLTNIINNNSTEGFSKNPLQIGVIASLFLFLVASVIVISRLFKNNKTDPVPLSFLTFNIGNITRIVFAVPFLMLMVSVYAYMSKNYSEPLKLLLGLIFYPLGGIVFIGILSFVYSKTSHKSKYKISLLVCFLLIIFSTTVFYYLEKFGLFYFMLFFSSMTTASLIMVVILSWDYLYKKLVKSIK